jgi:hypothetical protein
MPDESVSPTITIVDRTDTRPATRRQATHDLDVREAVLSVAGMAAGQPSTPGQPDSDTAWLGRQRQTRFPDWGLVVFGGGMGIVALIVLVVSVLTVSDDSTHQPAPPRSSVAPSAPSPTAVPPSLTAVAPMPSAAPPSMPATPTSSAQPAQTASSAPAAPPVPAGPVPRRLHRLFPRLFPAN